MSVTIVSVNLKTESGYSYLYTYDNVEGPDEFVELVEKDLGEELEYVYDFDLNVMYSLHERGDFVQALWERISEFDVREDVATKITSIRFSEDSIRSTTVASTLFKAADRLELRDAEYAGGSNVGYLVIANKAHAENLINALNKAISLGWL